MSDGGSENDGGRQGQRWLVIRRVAGPSILFLAGVAILIASSEDGPWSLVGFSLIGVAAVAGVSLAFYEVGLSEDRARSRDSALTAARSDSADATVSTPDTRPPGPSSRRTTPAPTATRPPRRRSRGDG